MPGGQWNAVRRFLRKIGGEGSNADVTDIELLDRFVALKDEDAFAVLMERHGPMVLGVCRRVLHHADDVDDAFQATFLVLVRKAAGLNRPERLGNWLYGVAHRTALKAREQAARRRTHESQVVAMTPPEPCTIAIWRDLQTVLDDELRQLPDKYRELIVLCCLEGRTIADAARIVRCPQGTVGVRLARARDKLRKRLARRGLVISAALVGTILEQNAAPAAVPATLLNTALKSALLLAGARTLAGAGLSSPLLTLTKGVLQSMFATKVKITSAALLVVALAATSGAVVVYRSLNPVPAIPDQLLAPPPPAAAAQAGPAGRGPERRVVFRERATLEVFPNGGTCLAFSPNGKILASAKMNEGIELWEAATGKVLRRMEAKGASFLRYGMSTFGHLKWSRVAAFSRDGTILATSGLDTIHLWDVKTGADLRTLTGHAAPVIALRFSPAGGVLASGDGKGHVKVWDVATGKELAALPAYEGLSVDPSMGIKLGAQIRDVAFSPDGKTLAVAWTRDLITPWNNDPATLMQKMPALAKKLPADPVEVKLWDPATGKARDTLTLPCACVAFSPDGKRFGAGGRNDGLVQLCELRRDKKTRTLQHKPLAPALGNLNGVESVTFSPDGKYVGAVIWVVGLDQKTCIKIWDATTGEELAMLAVPCSVYPIAAFSPDWTAVAVYTKDTSVSPPANVVKLYDLK